MPYRLAIPLEHLSIISQKFRVVKQKYRIYMSKENKLLGGGVIKAYGFRICDGLFIVGVVVAPSHF